MAEPITLSDPVYRFPIGNDDMLIVARITLMWGQIDSQLDYLMMDLLRLLPKEFDHLFAGRMVGPKVETISTLVHRARNAEATAKLNAMVAAVKRCTSDRNVMTHGLWSLIYDEGQWLSGAWSRAKQLAFFAYELRSFHNKVADAAIAADEAWHAQIVGHPPPATMNRKMFVSDGVDPADTEELPEGSLLQPRS